MICKTKYIEDLMLIYIFLSIMIHEGEKLTINTTKHCLFKLIELQPVECLFRLLVESSFSLHNALCTGAFCSVWNSTSSLLLFSIFHFLFTNFGGRPFSEKIIQTSPHLICIINRLHNANQPLAKDIFRLCPDIPIQKNPVYPEFCAMLVFRVVRFCCQHIL